MKKLPGDRYWVGMTLEASRRFSYGSCDAHTRYKSRAEARRAARLHMRSVRLGYLRCFKCRRGMVLDPFRCPVNPKHFHAGHEWRTRDDESSEKE